MQSKQAVQTQAGLAPIQKEITNPFLIEAEKIIDRMKELYEAIERRAYDLFAERGFENGHNLEDWLRAESEFLMNVSIQFSEDESRILVRAEVPGFEEKDIRLSVKPHRLMIHGKVEPSPEGKEEEALTDKRSKEFFCTFELPCDVEPSNTKLALKDEVLEISLPRLNPGEDSKEDAKRA